MNAEPPLHLVDSAFHGFDRTCKAEVRQAMIRHRPHAM
jgi:hypothetical protein